MTAANVGGKEFLSSWFSDCTGLIELRPLPSGAQSFHRGAASAAKEAERLDTSGGVFFGLAARDGRGGKKENLVAIPGLWIDIDFKDTPRERAEELLRGFPLRPTFIIASGGGLWPLWKFKEPAGREDIARVEAILRGIARALGGDKAATDASRIMRVPGTFNRKPEYGEPRRVEIIEANLEAQYNLSDFDFLADAEPEAPAPGRPAGAELAAVRDGCAFVRRWEESAKTLPEPEWYAGIGILARLPGGVDHVHSVSSMYPGYSRKKTDAKILHAMNASGPRTCPEIRKLWDCGKDCGVKSPAALARKAQREEEAKQDPKVLVYETLNPITLSDLIASDLPEPEPTVQGLLYPETVLVIGGLVKVRKTWTAMHLGLSGVAGGSFLGHAIPRKLRVLYIGGEGSERSIRKRFMLALGFIDGLQEEDMSRLGVVCSLGRIKFDTPAGEKWLHRVSEEYDVIIIDPWYRFLATGEENSHTDQRTVFDVLDGLKAKGKGIVVVHHLRKPTGADAGAAELRGAGLDGYADSILLLSRKKAGSSDRFTLKYVLRHDEEPDDLELEAEGPLLKVAEPLPPKVTVQDFIAAIDAEGKPVAGTTLKRTVKENTEAAKHEIDAVLAAAVKEKILGWRKTTGRGQGRAFYVIRRLDDAP